MGTNTPRLQLFKAADTDFADQNLDINNNLDKIDAAFPASVRWYKSVSTGQTGVAQGTVIANQYDVADRTDANYVTASVNKDVFTLNKTGWWEIIATCRIWSSMPVNPAPSEGFACIANVAGNNSVRYAATNSYSSVNGTANTNIYMMNTIAKRYFTAGQNIVYNITINNEGIWDSQFNSEQVYICFTYQGAT